MFPLAPCEPEPITYASKIAFALIKARKVVRGLRQGLTEQERFAVAAAVVWRLKEHGDPWRLSEEMPDHGVPAARP